MTRDGAVVPVFLSYRSMPGVKVHPGCIRTYTTARKVVQRWEGSEGRASLSVLAPLGQQCTIYREGFRACYFLLDKKEKSVLPIKPQREYVSLVITLERNEMYIKGVS